MRHIKHLCWAGAAAVFFGVVLCMCGHSFSAQWQTLGDDSGPSPVLALSVRTFGNATLLVGFALLAGAAWVRLNAKEQELTKLRAP